MEANVDDMAISFKMFIFFSFGLCVDRMDKE